MKKCQSIVDFSPGTSTRLDCVDGAFAPAIPLNFDVETTNDLDFYVFGLPLDEGASISGGDSHQSLRFVPLASWLLPLRHRAAIAHSGTAAPTL